MFFVWVSFFCCLCFVLFLALNSFRSLLLILNLQYNFVITSDTILRRSEMVPSGLCLLQQRLTDQSRPGDMTFLWDTVFLSEQIKACRLGFQGPLQLSCNPLTVLHPDTNLGPISGAESGSQGPTERCSLGAVNVWAIFLHFTRETGLINTVGEMYFTFRSRNKLLDRHLFNDKVLQA